MFRLLVVGKSEDTAREAASWAVSNEIVNESYEKQYEISGRSISIKAFPLWIDQKEGKPAGDGLLLVAKNAGDLSDMQDFIKCYMRMPIKFILCNGAEEVKGFESILSVKSHVKGVPIEFIEKLIIANNDLVKFIASVFRTFDKNNNRTIELSEIGAISKELGVELTSGECAKTMQELDINKVGLVTLEEFIEWWKTGGHGKPSQLGALIKDAFKENPILQSVVNAFNTIKSPNQFAEVLKGSLGIYLNRVSVPGASLEISLVTHGASLDNEFQQFSNAVGLSKGQLFVGLAFGVKNPKEAGSQLENIITTATIMGKSLLTEANEVLSYIDFKHGIIGNKCIVCAIPSEKCNAAIAPIKASTNYAWNLVLPNQLVNVLWSFASDFEKLITEERSLYDIIFDGMNFEIKWEAHPDLNERLVEFFQNSGIFAMIPEEVNTFLLSSLYIDSMFFSGRCELEFEMSQNLRETFNSMDWVQDLKTPLKYAKAEGIDSAREFISSIPVVETIHSFFKDEVNSIEVFLYFGGIAGIKIKANLPGLGTFLSL